MNKKGKMIILLSVLWSVVGFAVWTLYEVQNQNVTVFTPGQGNDLTFNQAKQGINDYFHSTTNVLSNASKLVPKP